MILRLLVIAASLASPVAHAQPSSAIHAIRGQIVDDLTGRPITDVELTLQTAKWQSAADSVVPDAQGRFVFRGLRLGEYVLGAARQDFGFIFFGQLSDGWIQTIDIRPGDGDKTVVFRLVPRSLATGIIRDEFGDPVVGAAVTMSRQTWTEKGAALRQVFQSSSDDRGLYRFANVPPGSYVICARANILGSIPAPSSSVADFQLRAATQYYVRTCYPEAAGLPQSLLHIGKAEHVAVDITLTPAPAVRVRGHVQTSVPASAGGVWLAPELPAGTGESWQAQVDLAAGAFEFRGVPPGPYRLEANLTHSTGEKTTETVRATRHIVVGLSDLDNVDLTIEPTAELEVVLHDTEGRTPDPNAVTLGLQPVSGDESGVTWAINNEGSLRFQALVPGTYWLNTRSVEGDGDTYCVQSAKLGDAEVLQGRLTVTPSLSAQLRVVVSKRCGVVTGSVSSNQKPLPDAKVLLLLSGTAKNPGDTATYFTDDRGEFTISALPFGRYLLWAWEVDESKSFLGPSSLAEAEKYAVLVTVANGQPVQVEITAVPPEKESR